METAARMEQSGTASQVHVSQDFYDLVDLPENMWCDRKVVTVKNMGQVQTYYHDPLRCRRHGSMTQLPVDRVSFLSPLPLWRPGLDIFVSML